MHDFDPYLTWLEIPPQERPADHYRLLGLQLFEADAGAISAAADARMAHLRTFQSGPRGAYTQPLLNEVARAKLCLLDPSTRQAYDQVLAGRISPGEPTPPPRIVAPPPAPPPQMIGGMMVTPMTPEEAAQSAAAAFVRPAKVAEAAQRRRKRPVPVLPIVLSLLVAVAILAGLAYALAQLNSTGDVVDQPPADSTQQGEQSPAIQEFVDGSVTFSANTADIHGNAAHEETQGGKPALVGWESESDGWVSWDFEIEKGGIFEVEMSYRVEPAWAGGSYRLSIGDAFQDKQVRNTEGQFVTERVFFITIRQSGRHTLNMRTGVLNGDDLMSLQTIKLIRRQ